MRATHALYFGPLAGAAASERIHARAVLLSACFSVCLSVCVSVCRSVCFLVCLAAGFPVCLSICLEVWCLAVRVAVRLFCLCAFLSDSAPLAVQSEG